MVLLLIEGGGPSPRIYGGDTPFGLTRIERHTEICDFLRTAMEQKLANRQIKVATA